LQAKGRRFDPVYLHQNNAGVAQLVEHFLAKEDVESSNLFARSNNASLAQLAEHWSPKPGVGSSRLSGCARKKIVLIEHVFTTPIAVDQLDVDNDKLEQFCKPYIYNYLNDRETQSGYLDIADPALAQLISIIESRASELHIRLGLNPKFHHRVTEAWANLNNPRETRIPHQHASTAFTCVYYVKGDETCGKLKFMSPVVAKEQVIKPEHIRDYNFFTSSGWEHSPIPGRLVIFPSWIYHYVEYNQGESERISIAFNTAFIEHQ
jgi:uncharacterized protein (TIGR02466 family)